MTDPAKGNELLSVRRDGVVVHAAGEVDLGTARRLADELTTVARESPAPEFVVVDLTDVTFLASAGLSVLVEHTQLCRDAGVELRVVPGNRTVARTISLTGLSDVLAIRDSLDEALEPSSR